jgi:hypothetical protein
MASTNNETKKKTAAKRKATSKKAAAPKAKTGKTAKKTAAKPKAAAKTVRKPKAEGKPANAEEKAPETKKGSYIPAVGRRKTSIARIRLIKNGTGEITVNGRKLDDYFGVFEYRNQVR